jgi:hypothetical protein
VRPPNMASQRTRRPHLSIGPLGPLALLLITHGLAFWMLLKRRSALTSSELGVGNGRPRLLGRRGRSAH